MTALTWFCGTSVGCSWIEVVYVVLSSLCDTVCGARPWMLRQWAACSSDGSCEWSTLTSPRYTNSSSASRSLALTPASMTTGCLHGERLPSAVRSGAYLKQIQQERTRGTQDDLVRGEAAAPGGQCDVDQVAMAPPLSSNSSISIAAPSSSSSPPSSLPAPLPPSRLRGSSMSAAGSSSIRELSSFISQTFSSSPELPASSGL
uniref:Uncharacterized protein n=1 Tax=Anopheles atroparvus TaxID=41427 RepID=A0A182IM00_ANOAO